MQRCRELVDEAWLDERFISLNVDDVGSIRVGRGGFGNTIRSRRVVWRGHDRFGAKIMRRIEDALVIGSNSHAVEKLAVLRALPDVLHKRFSSNEVERFPGEASRTPACWDYAKSMMISR